MRSDAGVAFRNAITAESCLLTAPPCDGSDALASYNASGLPVYPGERSSIDEQVMYVFGLVRNLVSHFKLALTAIDFPALAAMLVLCADNQYSQWEVEFITKSRVYPAGTRTLPVPLGQRLVGHGGVDAPRFGHGQMHFLAARRSSQNRPTLQVTVIGHGTLPLHARLVQRCGNLIILDGLKYDFNFWGIEFSSAVRYAKPTVIVDHEECHLLVFSIQHKEEDVHVVLTETRSEYRDRVKNRNLICNQMLKQAFSELAAKYERRISGELQKTTPDDRLVRECKAKVEKLTANYLWGSAVVFGLTLETVQCKAGTMRLRRNGTTVEPAMMTALAPSRSMATAMTDDSAVPAQSKRARMVLPATVGSNAGPAAATTTNSFLSSSSSVATASVSMMSDDEDDLLLLQTEDDLLLLQDEDEAEASSLFLKDDTAASSAGVTLVPRSLSSFSAVPATAPTSSSASASAAASTSTSLMLSDDEDEEPSGSASSSNKPEDKASREKRLEKNREIARNCRKRKREKQQSLEGEVNKLREWNSQLEAKLLQIHPETLTREAVRKQDIHGIYSLLPNASEADVQHKLDEHKEIYAAFGKERKQALSHHLEQLKVLLLPNQVSKMTLFALQQEDDFYDEERNKSIFGGGIWNLLCEELELTVEQKSTLLNMRKDIRSQRESVSVCLSTLKQLGTKIGENLASSAEQMAKVQRLTTPSQQAKFLWWIEHHQQQIQELNKKWGEQHGAPGGDDDE